MRFIFGLLLITVASHTLAAPPAVSLKQDDEASTLTVRLGDRELVTYHYGQQYAIPHYWPVRSPSGKQLTSQHPTPFPHHRSLWIADKIQLADRLTVDFYHVQKNYLVKDDPRSGFRHFIRHQRFTESVTDQNAAVVRSESQWIVNQTRPVIDESRSLRVVTLDNGEYLLDLTWELRPTEGEVKIVSDWVHYAWPYVRIHPQFSGEQGGVITNDRGATSQQGTNGEHAKWIDYSNTIDGVTEGMAIFIFPDGEQHKWLTREYGTFGPRRTDDLSGTQFTLRPQQSLQGRVGSVIHKGNVKSGRVAERYQQYVESKL